MQASKQASCVYVNILSLLNVKLILLAFSQSIDLPYLRLSSYLMQFIDDMFVCKCFPVVREKKKK